MTPIQTIRNVADMAGGPTPTRPSPMLERIGRIHLRSHGGPWVNTPIQRINEPVTVRSVSVSGIQPDSLWNISFSSSSSRPSPG